ncbi:uncharacterized protein LOC132735371 [Ruditapes philippinarum]|uniref:uncharacterized protein LOC132735371 n=1 Tax=Ruditapes philippinarum TaxID=129788 RepID=UPI00295C2106|nr:uncharacterized protein LOC132735371 [Ruditapes philippinarum]
MLTLIVVLIFVSLDGCTANDFDKLSQLLVRVEKLENAENKRNLVVKEQEVQIRRLQLEVLQERTAHTRFEEIINDEKLKNENLERRLNDQEKHIKEQNALITKLNNQFMQTNVETLMEEKKKRFLAQDLETVAFHATLDQDSGLEHIHVGSTIPFPNVKLNIGGGYNNVSSVFVAPTAGLYIVSTSISSYWNDKGELHVGIMKNGVYVAGATLMISAVHRSRALSPLLCF